MKIKDPSAQVADAFAGNIGSETTTREKILVATLAIIEREGAGHATVRAIAAEAGVNIAAINYHYRSKEELMEAAIEASWKHAADDLRSFLRVMPDAIGSGIEALILYLLKGGETYPNVTKAYLMGASPSGASPAILEGQRAFVAEFARIVAEAAGIPCDDALLVRTSVLYFFCLYTALVPESLPAAIAFGGFASCAKILSEDYLRDIVR